MLGQRLMPHSCRSSIRKCAPIWIFFVSNDVLRPRLDGMFRLDADGVIEMFRINRYVYSQFDYRHVQNPLPLPHDQVLDTKAQYQFIYYSHDHVLAGCSCRWFFRVFVVRRPCSVLSLWDRFGKSFRLIDGDNRCIASTIIVSRLAVAATATSQACGNLMNTME
jgi:hypothetical protein